jgi:hypothetical protein
MSAIVQITVGTGFAHKLHKAKSGAKFSNKIAKVDEQRKACEVG